MQLLDDDKDFKLNRFTATLGSVLFRFVSFRSCFILLWAYLIPYKNASVAQFHIYFTEALKTVTGF